MTGYLDCAATSFPKPRCVTKEVERCLKSYCGNPGRGSHRLALAAAEKLYETRELAANMFGLSNPENAVFTMNATHALNTALFGLTPQDAKILISDMEHNSVLRAANHMTKAKNATVDIVSTEGDFCCNLKKKVKGCDILICCHSSNITNRVLPLARIGKVCKENGIIFIVDASQSSGVLDIDMERDNISVLCFPGHKGLLSPQGIGMALFADGLKPEPLLFGGSGSESENIDMPDYLPDRLEAGTLPTPAVAGLCEGLKYIRRCGIDKIRCREIELSNLMYYAFEDDKRIEIYSEPGGGIFLFNIRGKTSQETSRSLDRLGICTRPGLHCAPLAHKTIGTPSGGAARASVGALTEKSDILAFINAVDSVAKSP